MDEGKLPQLPDNSKIKISMHRMNDRSCRPPMKVSMGPIVLGASLPHPDTSDTYTLQAGVVKRIATTMPTPDPAWMTECQDFVDKWLHDHCKPLSPAQDLSFETWIETRPYPEWRKQELRLVHEFLVKEILPDEYKVVNLFMKDEDYLEYKQGRGIYARCDAFKVLFGPLCSSIEEDMYANPEFIKHVPVADRPEYISNMLATTADDTGTTDFTSFECSFTAQVQSVFDQRMFKYYLKYIKSQFLKRVYLTTAGKNHIKNKNFSFDMVARRMSGEMDTSLANGFANLMVNKFLVQKLNLGELRICVEGDDGISKTTSGKFPPTEAYAKLGFNVKIQICNDPASASFCGIIYDPDEKINVTDPREVLAQFGWASQRYSRAGNKTLMALLRCKSLSYLHQYPGCPIIQELALYGLRMTKSFDVRHFVANDRRLSMWERDQLKQAISIKYKDVIAPVGDQTRILVEKLYSISLEAQYEIESYLRGKHDLEPLVIEEIDWPVHWVNYFNEYCAQSTPDSPNWVGKYVSDEMPIDLRRYVVDRR